MKYEDSHSVTHLVGNLSRQFHNVDNRLGIVHFDISALLCFALELIEHRQVCLPGMTLMEVTSSR